MALGVFSRPAVPHHRGEVSQGLDLVVDEPVGLGERQGLKQAGLPVGVAQGEAHPAPSAQKLGLKGVVLGGLSQRRGLLKQRHPGLHAALAEA